MEMALAATLIAALLAVAWTRARLDDALAELAAAKKKLREYEDQGAAACGRGGDYRRARRTMWGDG